MRILIALLFTLPAWAVIPASAVWSLRSDATAANVNGAVFDTGASFPLNNCTATSATGNSPVISCSGYSFVAGDVNHWIYTVSNTGGEIVRGAWKIQSVNSGNATVDASVGNAVYHNPTQRTWTVNSLVAGLASVASPTAITLGIDYSQGAAAICAITDLAIDAATNTNVTSAGCPFGPNHVGNGLKAANGTGFTIDWFVIQSVSGVIATLDKPAGTLSSTGGVAKLGGSASLNSTTSGSTDDGLFEKGVPGNDWFVRAGNYTVATAINIASSGGTQNPIRVIGFNTVRGDINETNATTATKPFIDTAGLGIVGGSAWFWMYLSMTGTQNPSFTIGQFGIGWHTKMVNTSTTANRTATSLSASSACYYCEGVSYRGRAFAASATQVTLAGVYAHDSDTGVLLTGNGYTLIINSIIVNNTTNAVLGTASVTAPMVLEGNTLYGAELNPNGSTSGIGTGVNIPTGNTNWRVCNNIIKGFNVGISHVDTSQTIGLGCYNAFHGNTTDVSGWVKGPGTVTGTNPAFTNVTQQTGSTATSSGSVITAASGNPFSSVVDNQDFITVISATTASTGKYLITGHTGNTVTVSPSIGTGSNIIWEVTLGRDYSIGTALAGSGYPGKFPGGLTIGYKPIGAVGKQGTGGGGTRGY